MKEAVIILPKLRPTKRFAKYGIEFDATRQQVNGTIYIALGPEADDIVEVKVVIVHR